MVIVERLGQVLFDSCGCYELEDSGARCQRTMETGTAFSSVFRAGQRWGCGADSLTLKRKRLIFKMFLSIAPWLAPTRAPPEPHEVVLTMRRWAGHAVALVARFTQWLTAWVCPSDSF